MASDTLPIGEALTLATQMKNHWRAFARIEELLQSVAVAQQYHGELEQQKTQLLADLAAIEEKKKADVAAAAHIVEQEFAHLRATHAADLHQANERVEQLRKQQGMMEHHLKVTRETVRAVERDLAALSATLKQEQVKAEEQTTLMHQQLEAVLQTAQNAHAEALAHLAAERESVLSEIARLTAKRDEFRQQMKAFLQPEGT